MNPALYKLIGLQTRGIFRRMTRGGKSPARIVVFVLGALICAGWLMLAAAPRMNKPIDPGRVEAIMPLGLLGICIITAVTSAGDKAIAFTPGEVDQLFPGPFTRRELLAYKLLKSTLGAVLTAAILSVIMLKYARWWPACFAAVFLVLLLIQWFSIVLLLAGQAVGEAAYSRMRRFIIIGAGALIFVGARTWIAAGAGGGESAIYQFRGSPVGRFVLAPFDPFARLMTANNTGQVLHWAILAAILDAGLVLLVFLLDAHYIETAIGASERRYAKIQRLRSGSVLSMSSKKTANWHLPMFPFAGGAGPIAWRQLTSAGRNSRGLLLLLVIVAIGAAPTLAGHGVQSIHLLIGVMGWLTFLCSSMLSFDFRGDVDKIESLKALPLRNWAVSAGQLVAPVVLLTILHVLMLGIAAFAVPAYRNYLFAAIPLMLPLNALLFASENLIFLLFPSRPAAVSPGDFQVMGRKFIFMMGKMLVVGVGATVALIAGGLTWKLTDTRLVPATIVTWVVLAAEVIAVIPLIAAAYRRFDPSIHTPA
ncbi:MAG TPA: putative ABC exporter domain-containing protein [Tepidisphaeraceae bacterium]|jgi:hypothetical protein|nr:putative ABC exporter domain-containing protein [Tepidisphaeraceae bacterium]